MTHADRSLRRRKIAVGVADPSRMGVAGENGFNELRGEFEHWHQTCGSTVGIDRVSRKTFRHFRDLVRNSRHRICRLPHLPSEEDIP